MTQLNIQTPEWSLPLLSPKRYKGAHGGRGCVHPDTLIDTPGGQIKIRDFGGGEVFSYHKETGEIVTAWATEPNRYSKEQLYEVVFVDGRKIIVTDEHRFLTTKGWVRLEHLSKYDACVCEIRQELSVLQESNWGTSLSELF